MSFPTATHRLWTLHRARTIATALVLVFVALGLVDRWNQPAITTFDADSPGYLRPVISFYDGQGLQQTNGRAVFYPSMLIVFLGRDLSFDAMVRWQQCLGALASLALWGCWLVFWALLPPSRLRNGIAGAVGVALMAFYTWNPSVISFEHSLRPEAVLPVFGAVQLLATGIYLLARTGRLPSGWLVPAGALAVAFAYFCMALKPSWILASGAAVLLVLVGWIRAGHRTRPALIGLAIGIIISVGTSMTYKAWMKPDLVDGPLAPGTFLPKMLFTVHADTILATLSEEIQGHGNSLLPERTLLKFNKNLRKEMVHAREDVATHPQWRNHGVRYIFNPDYLMFTTDIAWPLRAAGLDRQQIARFYLRSYLLAVLRHPRDIASKIAKNLECFFWPDILTFCARPWKEKDVSHGADMFALGSTYVPAGTARDKLIAEGKRNQAFADANAPGENVKSASDEVELVAARVVSYVAPFIAILFFVVALQVLAVPAHRAAFGPAIIFVLFLYSVPVANALNVAIALSLEAVGRYRQTYGMFYALALAAMLTVATSALARIILDGRRAGTRPEVTPAQAD